MNIQRRRGKLELLNKFSQLDHCLMRVFASVDFNVDVTVGKAD